MGGTREIDTDYKKIRYKECVAHSKLCVTFGEFKRRFYKDYVFYSRHNFKLPWLKRVAVLKYTDDDLFNAARKYTLRVEFRAQEPNIYATASRRGLLSRFTWLKTSPDLFSNNNYVYRYFFREQGAVYVGRTLKPMVRDKSHRNEDSSAVFRFAMKHRVAVPAMQILRKGLSGEDSQFWENKFVTQYRRRGFLIINRAATGVGTGSMGMRRQFSKKKFMKIACRYTSLSDFKRCEPKAHRAGIRNGWLKECDFLVRAFRPAGTLTKKYCFSIARKYHSRSELDRNDSTVYCKMLAHGWLKECTWFTCRANRTYEYCMKQARKCKCARELYLRFGSVSQKMYAKGWIKDCTWFVTPGPPESHMRKVDQYTKDGKLIAEYRSAAIASRATGCNAGKITAVCRGRRPWTGGFIWKYAD